jgi:hypothetical protein
MDANDVFNPSTFSPAHFYCLRRNIPQQAYLLKVIES